MVLIVVSTMVKAVPERSQAILGGDDIADLLEVEPHETLQLPNALDPLDVRVAVATTAAWLMDGRAEEPNLLVVTQGAL